MEYVNQFISINSYLGADSSYDSRLKRKGSPEYVESSVSGLKRRKESKHSDRIFPCDECDYVAKRHGN